MKSRKWFEVDRAGLRKLIERREKGPVLSELVQNAWDQNVTQVSITLEPYPNRPAVRFVVEDDDPDGFIDLKEAFTFFSESRKKIDPTKRGRFNIGEKYVIALCDRARICSTTGTVVFTSGGRRDLKARRDRGTIFEGLFRMTRAELADACRYMQRLIPPGGIRTVFNGTELAFREPVHSFEATLETEIADAEGVLRRRRRKTRICLHAPQEGEGPMLYEMGLPVVPIEGRWHVDVQQKVPLNTDRDNAPPGWLHSLQTLIVNQMHHHLTEEDASTWGRIASNDPRISDDAMSTLMDLRFGRNRVSRDPRDTEANGNAFYQGYTVVSGSQMTAQEWENARRANAIMAAGRVFPTPRPYSPDPDAPAAEVLPEADWTPGMRQVVAYARMLAVHLLQHDIGVRIVQTDNRFQAAYGRSCELHLNLRHLGREWFERGCGREVDELLLHEFGHEFAGDHNSPAYHSALTRLGAALKELALEQPGLFRDFQEPPCSQGEAP